MDEVFWQLIVNADFAVPDGYTATDLTPALLGYLGSPDPVLRDEYGYMILMQWLDRQVYAPDDVAALIDPLLENLQHGLGEHETDSVFLRSFSALILAGIVYNRHPFLTEAAVSRLLEAALSYFACEKDLRGHLAGKGWAHSCAHTADWLDELALNRHMNAAHLERILGALAAKVTAQTGLVYLYGEDDRMAQTAQSVLERGLVSCEAVHAWLNGLKDVLERLHKTTWFADAEQHSAFLNTKHFLRCLYVRLENPDLSDTARRFAPDVRAALLG